MMNWYSVRGTVGLWILLGAAACGSGNFSDQFAQEIQKDCVETLACASKADVGECVNKTATTTDKWSTDHQQKYIDMVVRCESMRACDYVGCISANPNSGYAATHQAQITWECQQRIGCRVAGGMMQTQAAVEDCIRTLSNTLNADTAAQVTFDGRSARCSAATGCAYTTCQ